MQKAAIEHSFPSVHWKFSFKKNLLEIMLKIFEKYLLQCCVFTVCRSPKSFCDFTVFETFEHNITNTLFMEHLYWHILQVFLGSKNHHQGLFFKNGLQYTYYPPSFCNVARKCSGAQQHSFKPSISRGQFITIVNSSDIFGIRFLTSNLLFLRMSYRNATVAELSNTRPSLSRTKYC